MFDIQYHIYIYIKYKSIMYKQYIYVYCLYIIDLFIFVDYQHKYYKLNLEVISATEK